MLPLSGPVSLSVDQTTPTLAVQRVHRSVSAVPWRASGSLLLLQLNCAIETLLQPCLPHPCTSHLDLLHPCPLCWSRSWCPRAAPGVTRKWGREFKCHSTQALLASDLVCVPVTPSWHSPWGMKARAAAGQGQGTQQASRLLLALFVVSQHLCSTYCIQDAVESFVCGFVRKVLAPPTDRGDGRGEVAYGNLRFELAIGSAASL